MTSVLLFAAANVAAFIVTAALHLIRSARGRLFTLDAKEPTR